MYLTIIAAGNVGKNPEARFTPSGQQVTSFSMAVNRQYTKGDGEAVKETTWLRVTTWGKLADVCNTYVKKGMGVLIEGTLSPDKETGAPKMFKKSDGSFGTSYEVTANIVRFLTRGKGESEELGGETPLSQENEDDFPF